MVLSQMDLEESCVLSIEANNLDKVKQLLSRGLSVNSFLRSRNRVWDTNCFTILAIAAFSGAKTIVEFLINKKAQINQMDLINSRTALHWAVASKNYEIAKMLVEAGAYVNALDRDYVSPLILAANSGDLIIVQMLIRKGALMTQCDRMRSSALHYASMRLHGHIARELISHGCVINTSTPYSFSSPLKYLIDGKEYSTALLLIEAGCDLKSEKWFWEEIEKSQEDLESPIENQDLAMRREFFKWLHGYFSQPFSLKSLARRTIRRQMSARLLEVKINMLNVPKYLKDYLMMKF